MLTSSPQDPSLTSYLPETLKDPNHHIDASDTEAGDCLTDMVIDKASFASTKPSVARMNSNSQGITIPFAFHPVTDSLFELPDPKLRL